MHARPRPFPSVSRNSRMGTSSRLNRCCDTMSAFLYVNYSSGVFTQLPKTEKSEITLAATGLIFRAPGCKMWTIVPPVDCSFLSGSDGKLFATATTSQHSSCKYGHTPSSAASNASAKGACQRVAMSPQKDTCTTLPWSASNRVHTGFSCCVRLFTDALIVTVLASAGIYIKYPFTFTLSLGATSASAAMLPTSTATAAAPEPLLRRRFTGDPTMPDWFPDPLPPPGDSTCDPHPPFPWAKDFAFPSGPPRPSTNSSVPSASVKSTASTFLAMLQLQRPDATSLSFPLSRNPLQTQTSWCFSLSTILSSPCTATHCNSKHFDVSHRLHFWILLLLDQYLANC